MVLEGRTYLATLKQYFAFSQKETMAIIGAIFLMGLTYSFNNWGDQSFNLSIGVFNLVSALLISAIAILVHVGAQRAYSLSIGLKMEFKLWLPGLIAALILMIVSRGYIFFFALIGAHFAHMPGHRLGHFRYGLNREDMARVSFIGIVASLILASIFAIIRSGASNSFTESGVIICAALAVFMALPLPPLPGFHIFAGNRIMFALTFAFALIYSYLLYAFGLAAAIPGAILLLILGYLAWTKWIRKK